MNLKEFIYKNEMSCEQAAFELDIHSKYLRRIWAGKKNPGLKLAKKIIEWSNREVVFHGIGNLDHIPYEIEKNPKKIRRCTRCGSILHPTPVKRKKIILEPTDSVLTKFNSNLKFNL